MAIDTEFIAKGTYLPRLSLIQISLGEDQIYFIDPVSFDDLTPLGIVLADEKIVKIFHAPDQDLKLLHAATQVIPKNIFDTQLAATF